MPSRTAVEADYLSVVHAVRAALLFEHGIDADLLMHDARDSEGVRIDAECRVSGGPCIVATLYVNPMDGPLTAPDLAERLYRLIVDQLKPAFMPAPPHLQQPAVNPDAWGRAVRDAAWETDNA